ncbi:superoxide dismutase [Ni] [Desulforhopalus sp. IMCC35007]|uniref:superoxide dismutase [Ni] n=1 Tax=Desulforhopalus sp. IMCC35007 TaxID=2569543 RepID=UPI0010AE2B3F|nr:superoxide dismutase [Ni] [Desulforhopalus sp. IMCC35007]TKB06432.1 superoxide dismutase [Desulforhopalus sp. IMCC35007]
MKKIALSLAVLFVSLGFYMASAQAHCEIPCGIYDDELRMNLIIEHAGTIEKSMKSITELESGKDINQLVRWVTNKDKHAEYIQDIVTQYFMTQRIKFDAADYDKKIAALHKMLVFSMKCKQTTDLANVESLRAAAEEFKHLYFKH